MKLTAVQFKSRERVDESRETLARLVEGCPPGLVVCPELAVVGYHRTRPESVRAVAEFADGPTTRRLGEAAQRAGAWVVCGFAEKAGGRLHNSAVVLDPAGDLRAVYRKRMLFEADGWATAGDASPPVFETAFGRLTVGICMDLNDDRFLADCVGSGAQVIAFPTQWEQDEGEVSDYWRMRLHCGWPEGLGIPHQDPARGPVDAVLVGANGYGAEGAYQIRGRSAVLDRFGVVALGPAIGDAIVSASVRPSSC